MIVKNHLHRSKTSWGINKVEWNSGVFWINKWPWRIRRKKKICRATQSWSTLPHQKWKTFTSWTIVIPVNPQLEHCISQLLILSSCHHKRRQGWSWLYDILWCNSFQLSFAILLTFENNDKLSNWHYLDLFFTVIDYFN